MIWTYKQTKNGMDVSFWQRERMFYDSNELMSHNPMGQI